MKILILGAFLLLSFTSQAQYVTAQEALTIIAEIDSEDRILLNNGQMDEASAEFAEKKYDVKSYYILTTKLNDGEEVEAAIRQTVFEIKNGGVTDQEYDTNNIADNDLSRIKENLETLLTQ